jgi:hypothetical protein
MPPIKIKDYDKVYNCIAKLQASPDQSLDPILEFASYFIDENSYIDNPFAYTEAAQQLWLDVVEEMNTTPRVLSFDDAILDDLRTQITNTDNPSEIEGLKSRIEGIEKRLAEEAKLSVRTMYHHTQERFKRTHGDQQFAMYLWISAVAKWAGLSYPQLSEYSYLDFIEIANLQAFEDNLKEAAEMDAERLRKQAEAKAKQR